MLLLAVATSVTLAGAWRLARRLAGEDALLQVIAFLMVVPIQIAALVLLVGGVLQTLRPGALCGAATLLGAIELATGTTKRGRSAGFGCRAVAARVVVHPASLVLGAAVALEYAWQGYRALRLPIFSYDALSYHLISPSTWVIRGRITSSGLSRFSDSYPQGQELVHAWTMTFLHSLTGTGVVVAWFAVLGATCVAWIARSLGARPAFAILSGLLFAAMPAVFTQVSAAYVDVAGAATALATLVLTFARPRYDGQFGGRARIPALVLVGASLGYTVAVKESNLPLVPIVLGMVAWEGFVTARRSRPAGGPRPRPLLDLLVTGVPLALVGSSWYVRNFLVHRNPFYPVSTLGFSGLGTFDRTIIGANKPPELAHVPFGLVGEVARSWAQDLHPHAFLYDQRLGGLGAGWLLVCVPCLVVVAVTCRHTHRTLMWSVLAPAVFVAVAPQTTWWARFSMTLAGVGCAAVAVVLERIAERPVRVNALLALTVGLAVATVGLATFPSDVSLDGRYASPRQLWDLAHEDDATAGSYPWSGYVGLAEIPARSAVAVLASDVEPFPQILIGTGLTRRVIALDRPTSTAQLAAQMRAGRVRYVILPPATSATSLAAEAAKDPRRFEQVSSAVGLDGSGIWRLGNGDSCPVPELSLAASGTPTALRLTGRLTLACGSARDRRLRVWRAGPNGPPWESATAIGSTRTDERGRFTFSVNRASGSSRLRYFVTSAGGLTAGDRFRPSAASGVVRLGHS